MTVIRQKRIPDRIKEITEILSGYDIDFKQFLKQLKKYQYERRWKTGTTFDLNKQTVKSRAKRQKYIKYVIENEFKRRRYCFFVDPIIAAKFRIVCLQDYTHPKRLIEAFMSAYIEGDSSLFEVLSELTKYHEKTVFRKKQVWKKKRFSLMKQISNYYSLPDEWFMKYSDLKTEELA